jgi:NAD(P)-dependent dehydrogenase (short-subunit alcohol dehydrogenase family)
MQQTLAQYCAIAPNALQGKIILITGATRGLGRALSIAVAAHGGLPLLLGRDIRRLESLADEIVAQGFLEPVLIPVNLEGATVDDYQGLSELIEARCGGLHGLVLNAAQLGELTNIENYDPVLWARVFQVNVHSQFLLVRALLPRLRAANNSAIIYTSSSVGRRGRAYWGAYAASKFAAEGLMQVLADELRDISQVRVNSLNPGRMRTRMRALAYPAEDPDSLPMPEELTAPFIYLLSDAGCQHHGCAFDIARD